MNGKNVLSLVAVLLAAILLAACGTKEAQMASGVDMAPELADIQAREKNLADQQTMLENQQKEVRLQQLQLAEKEKALDKARAAMQTQPYKAARTAAGDDLFPPNAKLGECYARVFVPHKMQQVTEKVLVKEASERIEVIPAQYETVKERVVIEEASQRLETVPAQYSMVTEKVLVQPAKKKIVDVEPVYATETEKILVKPAHIAWKKGTGPIQKIDEATGEIMCLVEIPAEYRTVTRRVLKSPATTKTIEIPARYETVERRVMTKPPTTRTVDIPAKYGTIEVTKLVRPAEEKRIKIPAEYKTVTKQQVLEPGHMEWRPILCETNMTRSRISDIQLALKNKGFDPGPVDGVIGSRTMTAVNDFQRKNGLLVSKYLTLSTLEALGVSPR
ncbi:MAG: peptidoglycan-binding domain-containing protein [Desulfobulbales bacterium]|nr:peptidoglycan-binding domain-containing protein [Desulfobulbales bacterium]